MWYQQRRGRWMLSSVPVDVTGALDGLHFSVEGFLEIESRVNASASALPALDIHVGFARDGEDAQRQVEEQRQGRLRG